MVIYSSSRMMLRTCLLLLSFRFIESQISNCSFEGYPDLHFTTPDLFTPNATNGWGPGGPEGGKRAIEVLPNWQVVLDTDRFSTSPWESVHHTTYLPTDWESARPRKYPIIVEFTGNGPWQDTYQDVSTGLPEHANMGYGLSGGVEFIWLSLPCLDLSGQFVETYWWGCPSNSSKPVGQCPGYYDVTKTLAYMKDAVRWVASTYNGDVSNVFITGWSRGALATNYFGLYDDEAASLFKGYLPYSHFDGQPSDLYVPYPNHDAESALERLKRLNGKPMFITCERNGTVETAEYLNSTGLALNATFMSTGFCNHNDQWTLRPSKARSAIREWLSNLVQS